MKKKLLALFDELSSDEQTILLALSVIYVPIGQSNLQGLLAKSSGFELKTIRLIDRPLREKLQKSELMVITQDGWRCNDDIAEQLMRRAVKEPWFNKLAQLLIAESSYYPVRMGIFHAIKQLRIFLYQGNESAFAANIEHFHNNYRQAFAVNINRIFFDDYDAAWFTSLPDQIKFLALNYFLRDSRTYLDDVSTYYQQLEHFFGAVKHANPAIVHTLIEQRLLRGNMNDAELWLAGDSSVNGLKLLATLRFLENRNDEAIELFNAALKGLKKNTGKRNISIDGLHGYFFNLALLKSRNPNNLHLLKQQTLITIKLGWQNEGLYLLNLILLDAVDIYQGKATAEHSAHLFKSNKLAYERLLQALLLYWVGEIDQMTSNAKNNFFLAELAEFCQLAQQLGYGWYAAVSSSLLQRLDYKNEPCRVIAQQYLQSPFNEIIDLLPQVSAWQRALDALTQLTAEPAATVQKELRLSWSLSLDNNNLSLAPKEQSLGKSGRWNKGRPISLKRLYQDMADFDYLSEQDRRICAHIKMEKEPDYYGYSSKEFYTLPSNAIIAAVGHPHVYWANQESLEIPVDITLAEPQLLVKEKLPNLHYCWLWEPQSVSPH